MDDKAFNRYFNYNVYYPYDVVVLEPSAIHESNLKHKISHMPKKFNKYSKGTTRTIKGEEESEDLYQKTRDELHKDDDEFDKKIDPKPTRESTGIFRHSELNYNNNTVNAFAIPREYFVDVSSEPSEPYKFRKLPDDQHCLDSAVIFFSVLTFPRVPGFYLLPFGEGCFQNDDQRIIMSTYGNGSIYEHPNNSFSGITRTLSLSFIAWNCGNTPLLDFEIEPYPSTGLVFKGSLQKSILNKYDTGTYNHPVKDLDPLRLTFLSRIQYSPFYDLLDPITLFTLGAFYSPLTGEMKRGIQALMYRRPKEDSILGDYLQNDIFDSIQLNKRERKNYV